TLIAFGSWTYQRATKASATTHSIRPKHSAQHVAISRGWDLAGPPAAARLLASHDRNVPFPRVDKGLRHMFGSLAPMNPSFPRTVWRLARTNAGLARMNPLSARTRQRVARTREALCHRGQRS